MIQFHNKANEFLRKRLKNRNNVNTSAGGMNSSRRGKPTTRLSNADINNGLGTVSTISTIHNDSSSVTSEHELISGTFLKSILMYI